MSPFEIQYGFKPRSTLDRLVQSSNESIKDLNKDRPSIRADAIDSLAHARALMALQYDKKRKPDSFAVGDRVYIENRSSFKIPGLNPLTEKLNPKRFGPFTVTKLIGKGACMLELPSSYKLHNVVSHRHLTKAVVDTEFGREFERPPPLVIDEARQEGEFEVESVIDKRRTTRGKLQYFVKWLGYPIHEGTWIDAS